MLDITANTFQEFPPMPELTPPLGLALLSFKFSSKWVANMGSFVASLVGAVPTTRRSKYSRRRNPRSQRICTTLFLFMLRIYAPLSCKASSRTRISSNFAHISSGFQCETMPSDELVAAIPRTIQALAVTNTTPDPALVARVWPSLGSAAPPSYISAAYLTEQLDSFPFLRVFR
ncbi:hypothetical protein B0H14DRAFT_3486028 [Mycena olivaceomarginata]|nr:hypothetical protein B0H14DRAFT_3486028 [Mycena olivaceomarginata]